MSAHQRRQLPKIAHVTPYHWPIVGGITTYVDALAHAQRGLGLDVRIYARHASPRPGVLVGPAESTRFVIWAAYQLLRWRPDVVHAHGEWTALAASQLPWGAIAGRTIFTVHTNFTPPKSEFRGFLLERLVERANVVTALSAPSAQELKARFPGIRRLEVLSPGSRLSSEGTPETAALEEQLRISRSHPRVCAVSMFVWPEKVRGLKMLVRSMPAISKAFPDVKLLIVGDGPLRKEVEDEIKSAGVQDIVTLVGRQEDPRPFIALCDVFAHLSFRETFGQVVLEALSLGKPVVVNREAARNLPAKLFDAGVFVVDATVPSVTEAIGRICSEKELRATLGNRAKQLVRDEFDWNAAARKMMSIYEIATGI